MSYQKIDPQLLALLKASTSQQVQFTLYDLYDYTPPSKPVSTRKVVKKPTVNKPVVKHTCHGGEKCTHGSNQ
jgi:hypothetical protein